MALLTAGSFMLSLGYTDWITGGLVLRPEATLLTLLTYVLGFALLILATISFPSGRFSRYSLFIIVLIGLASAFYIQREAFWTFSILYGLAVAIMAIAVSFPRVKLFGHILFIIILLSFVPVLYFQVQVISPSYGSDSLALSHLSAETLLQGVNPYPPGKVNLLEAMERFGPPLPFLTQTLQGEYITRPLSYPALHLLPFALALKLGVADLRWVVAAAQLSILLLIWFQVSPGLRPLIILPIAVSPNLFLPTSSNTDWLWALPLAGTLLLMNKGKYNLAALFYGLACGVKQTPWLAAPFLLVWVWRESAGTTRLFFPLMPRLKKLLSFATIATAVFLLPNLPFILLSPSEWLSSVFYPLKEAMIPFGQGFSLLTQHGTVSLPKEFYTLASVGIGALLLYFYFLFFPRLKHAIWAFVPFILWFSYRSLQNYFVYWIPLLILGVWLFKKEFLEKSHKGEIRESPSLFQQGQDKRGKTILIKVIAPLLALLLALSFLGLKMSHISSPLKIAFVQLEDAQGWGGVTSIKVKLENKGTRPVAPRFSVQWYGYPFYWKTIEGPETLNSGDTAIYHIVATYPEQAPPLDKKTSARRGYLIAVPFVLKVNDASSSTYTVSRAIGIEIGLPVSQKGGG